MTYLVNIAFHFNPPFVCFERITMFQPHFLISGVFVIAATQCDYALPEHERIFQTIYKQVTGDKLQCPRIGAHWDVVGFQGLDPATDLRGSGMLGPLQLLFLLKEYRELALKIFTLSRDELQVRQSRYFSSRLWHFGSNMCVLIISSFPVLITELPLGSSIL